jgi:ribonuclease HI
MTRGRGATASGRSATANIDGGSRGNPGPAGYGVHIAQSDGTIVELKEFLGIQTNNVAEYNGLLAALRWAAEHGVSPLLIRSDSERSSRCAGSTE